MKPIIAITVESKFEPDNARSRGTLSLNWNYAEEVAKAGGVPILIPPTADMDEIADIVDGWLIPGGYDIDAARFGEENHAAVELQDPARYDGEAALYRAVEPEMPIFGICYGCQFLNVIRGGTMIQHLPDVVNHEQHSGGTMQTYQLESASRLAEVVGTTTMTGKSYHHQAVGTVGHELRIVGHHEDGTIEAIEDASDRWLYGVQWHPERTPDDAATQTLFRSFIDAAREFRARKHQSEMTR